MLKLIVLYLTSCMIFVTLFLYWQVPYRTGHNPYGSNECKINWNWKLKLKLWQYKMFLIAISSMAIENLFPEKMCRNFQRICMYHSEQVNWFNFVVPKMHIFASVHFSFLLPINAYLIFCCILCFLDCCEATYCTNITVLRIINSWSWIFTMLYKCLHKSCRSQLNVYFMWYTTSLFS